MIQARSPYYAQSRTLLSNEIETRIELYIWVGDITTDKPGTPTYTFIVKRPSSTIDVLTKDISPMVRDFFINEQVSYFNTLQTTQNQTVWAQWDIIVVDDTGTDVDTTSSTTIDATMGYIDYMDNVNFQPSTNGKPLISSSNKIMWDGGILVVPISNSGIDEVRISYDKGLPATTPITSSDLSSEQIYYLNIDVLQGTSEIDVETYLSGSLVASESFKGRCEAKFDPLNIIFKNKFGVYENMYLFKKPQEAIQVKSEKFKSGISQGQTYNTSVGQYRKYNANAKETIKAMTGYVPETFNETIKQVVMSEKVFLQTDTQLIPINVKSEGIQFLSQLVDQKINYELEFEYAFDTINTM